MKTIFANLGAFSEKHFWQITSILILLSIVAFAFIDLSGGWYYTNGAFIMTSQEVRLTTNQTANVSSLNLKVKNFSKIPVIVRPEFTTIALNILTEAPNKTIIILFEDDPIDAYLPFSFFVSKEDDAVAFVPSDKPLQGTTGALYYAYFRFVKNYSFEDAYVAAEQMAIVRVSAQKNFTYEEYVKASGKIPISAERDQYERIRSARRYDPVLVK